MNQPKRVHTIDGIRGFSLLGILIANILIFQYGMWGKDNLSSFHLSAIDEWAYALIKIAIEGSFMPIFTFLFGYSFIMMRNSLERKSLRIKCHLFRRSLLLIGIGLLHATFFWDGDILLLYGGMGIILLLFVNRKGKTMLIWSIILFSLLTFISLFDFTENTDDPLANIDFEPYITEATKIYSFGSYSEIKEFRNEGDDPIFDKLGGKKIGVIFLLMPLIIAPMFLLGMYAGKKEWFLQPQKERKMYRIGMLIFLTSGLILKTYGYFLNAEGAITIGSLALSLGYICLLAMIYSTYKQTQLLKYFENVGKLSLTNYITQSVICTTIFYGYGLGLFAQLGVLLGLLLGIIIFIVQVIFSTFYIKHFRYGPLEKIVRIGTYLSFKNKKKKTTSFPKQKVS